MNYTLKNLRLPAILFAMPLFAACGGGGGGGGGDSTPPPVLRTLTVTVSGSGTVTNPGGINCTQAGGAGCTAAFADGTNVTLTATAGSSSTFRAWAGSCTPGNQNVCQVLMDQNRQEVAIFEAAAVGGIGDTFALTQNNRLVSFDRATPGAVESDLAVTGLTAGDQLVAMDFRPSNGLLYALALTSGGGGRVYLLNEVTGGVTELSVLNSGGTPVALSGTEFGMDFDPTSDDLYISTQDKVLSVNPATGALDTQESITAEIRGFGFTNAFKGTATTTAYAINSVTDQLVKFTAPNTLTTIGLLGFNASQASGFDIDGVSGTAFIAYNNPGPEFRTVNLATGVVSGGGAIGFSGTVRGLAVPTPDEPEVFAICESRAAVAPAPNANPNPCVAGRTLVKFRATNPASYTVIGEVDFADTAETVRALDIRPATGQLVAVSSAGKLYSVNTATAAPLLLSTLAPAGGDDNPFIAFDGDQLYGADFDAVRDRLRIAGRNNDGTFNVNLRVNADTGETITDGILQRSPFTVGAVAYSNNAFGATSATLYAIDSLGDRLFSLNGGNGRLTLIGDLGVDANVVSGFEITSALTPPSTFANTAYAMWSVAGVPRLFTVNLTTGQATMVAQPIGTASPLSAISQGASSEIFASTGGSTPSLISFQPVTPGTIASNRAITGLQPNEEVLGMDFQPGTNALYALGSTARLYTINTATGVAVLEGVLMTGTPPVAFALTGTRYGMDFDPTNPNNIKLVDDTGGNFTINATTTTVAANTSLIRIPNPVITSAAYTNSFAGATSTELLVFNANGLPGSTSGFPDTIMRVTPQDVGYVEDLDEDTGLDADTASDTGLDIAGGENGLALFGLQVVGDVSEDSFTTIYRFDPTTGGTTVIGAVGVASTPQSPPDTRIVVRDIAIRFPPQ